MILDLFFYFSYKWTSSPLPPRLPKEKIIYLYMYLYIATDICV